jgi:hypothetical protein
MQGGVRETSLRQARIKRGKAKGEPFMAVRDLRQQPAQFLHHGGTGMRHGKRGKGSELWQGWPGMFSVCSRGKMLEQKENIAKGAGIIPLTHGT